MTKLARRVTANGRERGRLLVEQIYAEREKRSESRRPSSLRPSELGHECDRYLWLRFRWSDEVESFDGRMLRLFDRGQREEARFVEELRWVGATVYDVDPDDPKTQISMELWKGHSKGFLDGVGTDIPHAQGGWLTLEFKTHSAKSFRQLEKEGVEVAKPIHYAQMQLYMHEHSLSEALYFSVNKDTDELYAEFVPLNESYARRLLQKAERIIFREDIPPRVNEQPTFYKCKMCSAAKVCHDRERPARNCRNCMYGHAASEAEMSLMGKEHAGWVCTWHDAWLDLDAQRRGCEDHRYHPHIVLGENSSEHIEDEVHPNMFHYIYSMPDGTTYVDKGPSGDRTLPEKEVVAGE